MLSLSTSRAVLTGSQNNPVRLTRGDNTYHRMELSAPVENKKKQKTHFQRKHPHRHIENRIKVQPNMAFRQSMKIFEQSFHVREEREIGTEIGIISYMHKHILLSSIHTAERAKLSEEKLKPEH